jgi:hypothetical protein
MNTARLIRSLKPTRKAPSTPSKIYNRKFGAGGQPQSQSQQARLWEGHNTEPEGWETTVYATYAASAVLITLALGFAPDTSIGTWASNEAQIRLDLKKEGMLESAEFGTHYNVPSKVYDFDMKIIDNPFNEDDDDDDDDDDDEDDDDDDEEEGEGEEEGSEEEDDDE